MNSSTPHTLKIRKRRDYDIFNLSTSKIKAYIDRQTYIHWYIWVVRTIYNPTTVQIASLLGGN